MHTEDEKNERIKKSERQRQKSKITPIRFRYNESDDPVIDAFILHGLRKEADVAEERVNSDAELSQVNPSDGQYEQIVARLKEMGVWEEDEEEEALTEEEHERELEEARKEIAAANRGRERDVPEETESGLTDEVEYAEGRLRKRNVRRKK